MIKLFLILNASGKIRVARFYEWVAVERRAKLTQDLMLMVSSVEEKGCNFFDDNGVYDGKSRIVFRTYASLHFIAVIDDFESELGTLDLLQVIVEAFDRSFDNVCELDLIFNPDKINAIIDEIICGGIVIETNLNDIVESYRLGIEEPRTST
eukprot:TRINITY_DN7947_c0_g2_i2.p1 TRINITY_DN7947_c0_g2~~TRINITY_DN7947_c0_g2_i2.p1  ORF type:complete len:152 (-),score=40.40 TRINITY_DN7947_c0_g2_i2:113-568(-)